MKKKTILQSFQIATGYPYFKPYTYAADNKRKIKRNPTFLPGILDDNVIRNRPDIYFAIRKLPGWTSCCALCLNEIISQGRRRPIRTSTATSVKSLSRYIFLCADCYVNQTLYKQFDTFQKYR